MFEALTNEPVMALPVETKEVQNLNEWMKMVGSAGEIRKRELKLKRKVKFDSEETTRDDTTPEKFIAGTARKSIKK